MELKAPVKPRPYRMENQIQHYEWGTRDEEAFIPRLLGIAPEPGLPYAELWMGAHPSAPSRVFVEGKTARLSEWISAHPVESLGAAVARQFSGTLPFLFKVLSAGEALSIQAHPNKAQAKALHARDPQHYPDDNHKPELAVALDSLTALLGIKPVPGMIEALERYPELADLIGDEIVGQLKGALSRPLAEQQALAHTAFSALVERSITQEQELVQAVDRLTGRLTQSSGAGREEELIFLGLGEKYARADVGRLAVFLLNLVHLEAGQGIFTRAGVPHAYLKGNIVECMANSDNVVRVGLTPKFKDARALIDILDREPTLPSILAAAPDSEQITYPTPASEFQVSRWNLVSGAVHSVATYNRPSILLIVRGDILIRWETGTGREQDTCRQGQSLFIPACLPEFEVEATSPAQVFVAQVPPGWDSPIGLDGSL